jgi:Sulfotransferase family
MPSDETSSFHVPAALDWFGWLATRFHPLWHRLGRLETFSLARELQAVHVTMPIYICGLARSGSTLLHQVVSSHPSVATHRLKDYPFLLTPYWSRQATARQPRGQPHERAHQDGILIDANSPDALEEMVWTSFFPRCHDPSASTLLSATDDHPTFASFYRDHIRKLLLAERANRYAAKANYHVARLPYLLQLFPDARFVLAVREPASHIGSLIRQHRRFSEGQRGNRRALEYMQRSGHFEFGLDRRPLNLGDEQRVRTVIEAWKKGEEVRGWARYWSLVYDHLANLLRSNERIRQAAIVVRFETFCDSPAEILRGMLEHCRLPDTETIVEHFAGVVRRLSYYQDPLSADDRSVIRDETAESARWWGYESD